jgi:quercetin dioxygenase-like cupin family protein
MDIIRTTELPFAEFGEGIKRQVRIIVSPEITGEKRMSLVHVTIPPGAKSEGHIHDDFDEYILFQDAGAAILDGVKHDVPAQGVVHARSGVWHECVNTSPDRTLVLFCIFMPSLVPYGAYPELIRETKKYLGLESDDENKKE